MSSDVSVHGDSGELVGTRVELHVDNVAHGGWCVGRLNEQVVFVRHALPGERVRALVTSQTKRFLRADAVEIVEPSPDRVEPPCPYAGPGKCGGCDWQHASLEAQRRLKGEVVTDQLRRIAGIEWDVHVEELPGTPDGLGWRTRVRFAVDADGHAGFRRHRSHEIQPVDECVIAHPDVTALGVTDATWEGFTEVEAITSATHADNAVVVTPRGARMPSLPTLRQSTAVLRRFNKGRLQQVRGRRGVRETVNDREYRVSANSFWQVHPAAARTLSDAVLEVLRPEPGDTALDLYCGAGLFAGALANAVGEQGRVLGVESDPEAVRDAQHNLRDMPSVRVEQAEVASQLREWVDMRVDVAVVDPPRTGVGEVVAEQLAELRNRRVAYVSCDPATLARDLGAFIAAGYTLEEVRAFDSFPMTHHVEIVASLVRN